MKRSRLKNKVNKTKDPTGIRNYKKQKNYVVNLNKDSKCESNDNRPFWVNCKTYFTNKHVKVDTDIMLSENRELILKKKEIASKFNEHFGSFVDNHGLDYWDDNSLTMGSDRIDKKPPQHKEHQSKI